MVLWIVVCEIVTKCSDGAIFAAADVSFQQNDVETNRAPETDAIPARCRWMSVDARAKDQRIKATVVVPLPLPVVGFPQFGTPSTI